MTFSSYPFCEIPNTEIIVSPSLLAADFRALGADIANVEAAGISLLHLDIMDGHFVPNLSYGPPLISSIRQSSTLFFDTHLMLTNPADYVDAFRKAGSDLITFHVECAQDAEMVIRKIRESGALVGISVKPKTPASAILPYLEMVDMVLVMSVEPGFGGQSFMPEVLPKTREIRDAISALGKNIHLQIDGGIDARTAPAAREAGANVLVAGTAVFRYPEGIAAGVAALKG